MKFRRFTPAGIAAVRDFLAKAKESSSLDLVERDRLLSAEARSESGQPLSDPVTELADLDFDPSRTFDTTFAFCEYLDSILATRNPQAYREDVGFWTYLAVAYIGQLIRESRGHLQVGEEARIVYSPENYQRQYRHLLAGPYYLYDIYRDKAEICKAVMWHKLSVHPDLTEQIVSRYDFAHNPAYMATVNTLYFDKGKNRVRNGANSAGPGSPRRLVVVVDQLALTRDYFGIEDANALVALLPEEFNRFRIN